MVTLFLGVVFGAFGLGYFVYGKRQQALVPLTCGLLLTTCRRALPP